MAQHPDRARRHQATSDRPTFPAGLVSGDDARAVIVRLDLDYDTAQIVREVRRLVATVRGAARERNASATRKPRGRPKVPADRAVYAGVVRREVEALHRGLKAAWPKIRTTKHAAARRLLVADVIRRTLQWADDDTRAKPKRERWPVARPGTPRTLARDIAAQAIKERLTGLTAREIAVLVIARQRGLTPSNVEKLARK